MNDQDIRWKQRLQNYRKGLSVLQAASELSKKRPLTDLEKQGLIQAFEFTHELAWNVMRDYFEYQGTSNLNGSRDATREAFQNGLLSDGDQWMEMIKSRNQSSHTYNQSLVEDIATKIQGTYLGLFVNFLKKMSELEKETK